MADVHPGHQLRVRLADRALTQTNQLLGVAAQLLDLAGGRATASQVFNLAQCAPVRAQFGFTDDDLEAIAAWVRESGVRWGFGGRTRVPYGLGDLGQNTWRFGMDRVLAGVGMSDDSQAWIGSTVPLDDVGSSRVELAGRLAEFVDRLTSVVEGLAGVRALSQWLVALRDAVVRLTRTDTGGQWQLGQLDREFADVLAAAGTRGVTPMRLADVRALLERHLAGRPTRANFRTGTLTVCTMVPMRSVPHRVVCLVGLDDGVFPRIGVVDGDDVLARDPVTGERDIRSEDRQLLLDAICAATEKLVITYTGADERTGDRRPPAVPLGELLDTLDRTTSQPVRHRIVVRQPLQPFGISNVIPGALGAPTPFTFDPLALVAAEAMEGERVQRPEFIGDPLPAPPPEDVSLEALVEFFRDPVKGFFLALEFTLPTDVDGVQDAMPVEIDNLQRWAVGDRMLANMLRGSDPDRDRDWALQAEMLRGTLPPGELGEQTAAEIYQVASDIAALARDRRAGEPQAVDVDIDLGGGRRLSGTVNDIYGERIVSVTYSKLEARHVVGPWISLLALAAAHPQRHFTSVRVGRSSDGTGAGTRVFAPSDAPLDVLRDLIALYDMGRCEPLPLPVKTSYAWAEARRSNTNPIRAAQSKWKSGRFDGEDRAPAHVKAWGSDRALEEVLTVSARPGEAVPGESTRLGAYAARLWGPMLRAERRD
jgi:exodeoxyribonuclease V gamma subunit